ncbi:cytochrome c biogenesis protein CcsA [Lutibacter sp.]|uniref:cytochrome c biogenesis protein n=1 Tax=Lutibacter sp. TaxID=1925666 RepID=UPI0025BF7559|nr:cytochrome c biogenesis protein CcsA [Lutibacter sp.]MCF6182177.1 cytochrome c biogenesis protein CcsA [Lutibacter sp.]
MNKILSLLYSTKLTAILFIVFATSMGIATFIENDFGTETARALVYNAWWFEGIMLFFVVNFFGNIFKYKLYKKEKLVTLSFHLAFIFILIGAGITRYISFEGVMPIKEGEVSNTFFSESNYISVYVDNGKVQKVPKFDKILLSSITDNHYTYTTKFKDKDVSIRLIKYIPHATTVFENSPNGATYLKFVESSNGGRHDHYIKQGTSEVIHGSAIGFDTPSENTINFKYIDGKLKIKSVENGTFFRMADKFNGNIVKDSLQDFSILAVHNIGNLQFVIPQLPIKGTYKTVSGGEKSNNLSQLTFKVSVDNKTRDITVKGGKYSIQRPTSFTVDGLNFKIAYGARQFKLPFSIKLRDFQLDKYPGSQSPMSYASEVTVISPEKTFDFRIFMNHILNYKGYKFFQSSYDITPQYEETRLSVNHDFWGTTITYIGYFLLYAGLILIFFMKNTRFDDLRKNLRKLQSKKVTVLLLAFLATSSFTFSQNNPHVITNQQIDSALVTTTVSKEHAAKFSKLIIQDLGGRMKPVDTYSSQLLRKISKHDTFKDMNSDQVFLSIQLMPRIWFQVPIIYLERGDTKLRDVIGVPHNQKYASIADFFTAKGQYKLAKLQQKASKTNIKGKFEKDIINVDKRINLFYSALMGDVLRIFPVPNDPTNKWVSQNELKITNYKGKDSIFARQLLPVYLQSLSNDIKTKNYSNSDEILGGLIKFQKKYGKKVYPTDKKINLEIAYNKYDVFKKLFSYYMYIGTLLFFLVIIQIFSKSKIVDYLIKLSIAIIIILFLMHTGGLIARWMISGHAPWSNAYESMIYVGWATMFFGLVFGRKSSMTIAATAFLTAFILMIAHWNWMDPEIANLVPVLNSYWLMIHVAIIVASYGPFGLGMILGIISLLLMILTTEKNKKQLNSKIKELTIINEMALTVGLVMITVGNFLGGMWANESWGRYWGWDPKETWALISIMVYAFVLHIRLVPGLRSRFTFNLFSVAAFASILFTYFGVNFYLAGLHSYASGDKAITPSFVYYTMTIFTIIAIAAYYKFKKYYKK